MAVKTKRYRATSRQGVAPTANQYNNPANQSANQVLRSDTSVKREPITSNHMLLAWVCHGEGAEFLRQLLDLIVESQNATRQQLEGYAAQHRARNMVELAGIVEEYAAKCPDMWDLRFCPAHWADSPDQWVAHVKRCGHN